MHDTDQAKLLADMTYRHNMLRDALSMISKCKEIRITPDGYTAVSATGPAKVALRALKRDEEHGK